MARIQLITIFISVLFIIYIFSLIIRGKLREEYSIVWIVCALLLGLFSFWRNGLEVISGLFGIYEPPNLVFTASIFIIFIYLLHLSVTNSKLQNSITKLTQEIALLKEKLEKKE
jgi:hypothetical protein